MNPSRLAVSITTADGQVTRFGPGETDAGRVAEGLSFSTAIPGGYRSLTLNLRRRADVDFPDIQLLSPVRVYGPGNRTVFEGRVSALPRQHGDGYGVQVQVEGWAAHLRDDESARGIYIDRDLGRWHPPGLTRRGNLLAAGAYPDKGAVSASEGALHMITTGPADKAQPEAVYDAGPGQTVKRVILGSITRVGFGAADANLSLNIRSWSDDIPTAETAESGNLADSTSADQTMANLRRYATLNWYWNTTGGAAAGEYGYRASNVIAIGNHGLTLRGTSVSDYGLYASDVIGHAISQFAPKLTSSIEATTFAIPHLTFPDCTTAEDIVSRANAFHLWEWGVYDDKVFFYRMPSADRLTWEARLSEGAHLSLEGDQADDLVNGVIVQYQDPVKGLRTVGPTGASTDDTSASLIDSSATNIANAHGYSRKWQRLDISQVTTLAAATQIGQAWLALNNVPQRKGQITLTGLVRHPTEGRVPAWRVRAGDYVRVSDHPADVPRRIVETTYDHDSGRVTCSVGSGADTLSAILERIGVAIIGI